MFGSWSGEVFRPVRMSIGWLEWVVNILLYLSPALAAFVSDEFRTWLIDESHWRWVTLLGLIGLLALHGWRQYQTLHPLFDVDFSTPWCEKQTDHPGTRVIRSEVSVIGATGKVCVDLVDIQATRNTRGSHLSISWTDSPEKWQRLPVGELQPVTIGKVDPQGDANIRWFTVRAPGPAPSQGTDRMTAADKDDPFIYFRLRVVDKSAAVALNCVSEQFRLGVKDGEPFCESVQEATNS
jgi:hypothetical protein